MAVYMYLAVAIILNMAGHLSFKAGAVSSPDLLRSYLSGYTIFGMGSYGFSAIAYIAVLRTMPLSVAMPTMVVAYLGTALAAHWIWGEVFGVRQMVAFLLVAAGLYLLHR